jgi:lipopolysaccharide export LptBFGC system permease protein LptF
MRLILIFLLLFSSAAEARMYQWVEPGVETTQLSGKPPVWYRSVSGGPRIFVFENGRLIDDTGIEVSDEVRQRLREEAFIQAEKDRQKAEEKIAKANELKQKQKKNDIELEDPEVEELDEQDTVKLLTDTLFPEDEEEEQQDSIQDFDELRKIIADWEAAQSENAREALQ